MSQYYESLYPPIPDSFLRKLLILSHIRLPSRPGRRAPSDKIKLSI
jgi:hypothetical protein